MSKRVTFRRITQYSPKMLDVNFGGEAVARISEFQRSGRFYWYGLKLPNGPHNTASRPDLIENVKAEVAAKVKELLS